MPTFSLQQLIADGAIALSGILSVAILWYKVGPR